MTIKAHADEAMAAALASDDERLSFALEAMAPSELLTLHRVAHRIANEAAWVRRRKLVEVAEALEAKR